MASKVAPKLPRNVPRKVAAKSAPKPAPTVVRAFVIPGASGSSTSATSEQSGSSTSQADESSGSSTTAEVRYLPDFVPTTEAEMAACLRDPLWRICSGQLYKIMVKSPTGGEESSVLPFIPNRAQRKLMARLWHRNIILKARQLGFTTLVAILWLDHALFNHDQRCVIVAQNIDKAEEIFRDKVLFAYERLPESLRAAIPLKTRRADELLFANNSAIKVSTSARGGTPHRLHISEYGKICADTPDKAREIVTGSLPAVPIDGITIIESTAEGQEGDFYDKTQIAIAAAQQGKVLTQKDFRIHFFPWWQEPAYRISTPVVINDVEREYFSQIEAATGTTLDLEQRQWYVATRDGDFSGDPELMWQEYPSTAKEAFQVSTEGVYYAVQLAKARKEGRICHVPHVVGVPVNTFWDIGNTDGTAIWLHQRVGFENRFIGFIEGWSESYSYYVSKLQALGYVWGTHYLPHDAAHKRQQGHKVASPEDELRELMPGADWEIVPVVDEVIHGIQKMRDVFGTCFFDEEKCSLGIRHLGSYRKTWDKARGKWKVNTPSKIDGHSEAPDALRQMAQGYIPPRLIEAPRRQGNWRTA